MVKPYSYDRTASNNVVKETRPESAYLHSGNGGLNMSVERRQSDSTNPVTGAFSSYVSYSFHHRVDHMGGGSGGSFDITPDGVEWMIEALQRTLDRMKEDQVSDSPYDHGVDEYRDGVKVSPESVPMTDSMTGG